MNALVSRPTIRLPVMFPLVLVLVSSLTAACARPAAGVIIAGSTSVQPYAEILAEEYAILYPDKVIDIQGGGSSAGITAAESGTADIGMSSRELSGAEEGLWSVEIAKDGLAIIINPDNPIEDLSLNQVRDIYSAKISDWSELGGAKAKIHIIAREDGSGTRNAFESLVMGSEQINPKAIIQDSNGAVRQVVSSDQNSIGFVSLGLIDHTVRAIKLEGVAPTWENVMNGNYSLFRPFIFITNNAPEGPVKQFIDFTLSPEGQQVLIHEGLIPQRRE